MKTEIIKRKSGERLATINFFLQLTERERIVTSDGLEHYVIFRVFHIETETLKIYVS